MSKEINKGFEDFCKKQVENFPSFKDKVGFDFAVGSALERVLNYLNRYELPKGAYYSTFRLVLSAMLMLEFTDDTSQNRKIVKSISEDGASITFETGSISKTAFVDLVEKSTFVQLVRYRRMTLSSEYPEKYSYRDAWEGD